MKRIKKKKKKVKKPKYTAATADKHVLYEKSVQCADSTIELIDLVYAQQRDKKPLSLKEDFCGTASLCSHWVASDEKRTATGVDFDQPTLDWGIEHNIKPLGDVGKRVTLVNADVRDGIGKGFDVIGAFNFSYFIFHERKVLKAYLKTCLKTLAKDGVLLMDMFGGPDAQFEMDEPQEKEGFEYVWSQGRYDPINNHHVCKIHFRFEDGTEMNDAFVYDWRQWTLPEVKDILMEVGFSKVDVWWDMDKRDAYSDYQVAAETENVEAWVAYIAAWK